MKTMILDNDIENIKIFDQAGVDRIFLDLEILGKVERQGSMDTVISDHSLDDIKRIKPILNNAELLVRVNPMNDCSASEISTALDNGADILMLPMFKTAAEVSDFIKCVDKRGRVCLLLETSEALCRIDDILEIEGIDEIHIGLNDLHLSLGLNFMFELLGGDLIQFLAHKIALKNIPFGIGGVARMDDGMLSGKIIMTEHARLNSTMVILSRTFKGKNKVSLEDLKNEISKLHQVYDFAKTLTAEKLIDNKNKLKKISNEIALKSFSL